MALSSSMRRRTFINSVVRVKYEKLLQNSIRTGSCTTEQTAIIELNLLIKNSFPGYVCGSFPSLSTGTSITVCAKRPRISSPRRFVPFTSVFIGPRNFILQQIHKCPVAYWSGKFYSKLICNN